MSEKNSLPSPLLIPVLFWCLGLILGRFAPIKLSLFLVAVVFGGTALTALSTKLRVYSLLLLILLLGMLRFGLYESGKSVLDLVFQRQAYILQPIEFEVRTRLSSQHHSYEVKLLQINEFKVNERILLFGTSGLEPGTTYRAVAELLPVNRDPVLDTGIRKYNAKAYLTSKPESLGEGGSRLNSISLRNAGVAAFDRKLGSYSGLAKALIFSDASEKQEWNERLSRSGLIHLVVVSGLHVWFIYLILTTLLNLLLPRKLSETLFLVLILGYASLNGWAAPISRSVIMIAVFLIARWKSRPVSKVQILVLSLLIITAINPAEFFSIGLQLSFVSIAIIMFGLPNIKLWSPAEEHRSSLKILMGKITSYLVVSLAVGIGIFPITLFYFGRGSLNGVVGSLLGIPLIGLMVPLSFLLLILPAGTALFQLLFYSYVWMYTIFGNWVDAVGRLPFYYSGLYPNPVSMTILLSSTVCLFLLVKKQSAKIKYILLPTLILLLILLITPIFERSDKLTITVFDAGVADCSLIELPGGYSVMVDTGMGYGYPDGIDQTEHLINNSWMSRKLLRWLQYRRFKTIDYVILSHMHSDHYGGLPILLKSRMIKNIIATDETLESELWKDWESRGFFESVRIHEIRDTLSYWIGDTRLKFLHPDQSYYSSSLNNLSLVFRMDFGSSSYLFTGDIEIPAEEYLMDKYFHELDSDYLKVAHHGSKSSSSDRFIRAVSPKEAWIPTSSRNRFGFPHQESIQTLVKYNTRISRTHNGSIVHVQKKH